MPKAQARRTEAVTDLLARLPQTAARSGDASVTISMLTANPGTQVARELISRLPELMARGIRLEAIFAHIPSRGTGSDVVGQLAANYGTDAAQRSIRLARFSDARSLHEQVVFGTSMLWTGAPLGAWTSYAFDAGEWVSVANDNNAAQLAQASFRAVWAVSQPVAVPARLTRSHALTATASA